MAAHNRISLTGQRFGALVVLHYAGIYRYGRNSRRTLWRCRCDCGQEVTKWGIKLRNGRVKACGVNGHTAWDDKALTFIQLHPPEYKTWLRMHARCRAKKGKAHKLYSSRGITVCDRWSSFELFFADMGPKPTAAHTIERKNNDGNYEPGNCCWATTEEQQRNRRASIYVAHEGEKIYLMDLVKRLGLDGNIVRLRLRAGWSLEDALSIPVRPKKKNGEGPRSSSTIK